MDNKNTKPGDINEDGLEIEQDGWITRVGSSVGRDDNRLIDELSNIMVELERKEVE